MSKQKLFSSIPKVDEMLRDNRIDQYLGAYPLTEITECVRETLEDIRTQIKGLDESEIDSFQIDMDVLCQTVGNRLEVLFGFHLKRVINATGVVIHTNLGRSLAAPSVLEHLGEISSRYSNLEFDLGQGVRGSRYSHVEEIICKLTGAEAAMVVNNNAAAVMLALSSMAQGKEAIVSRGQLVEIGGSFRIPAVMAMSGATLVEVGTTNKTHLKDYQEAITENTALLMKVHTSNFRILGFTSEVSMAELSALGQERGVPVLEDLGSGGMIDFSKYGLTAEPTVRESLESGADVVTFSGDKMLGGPQAGIIAGKKCYVDKMKKNQLTRALRVDKMTLALLEGTLKLYLDESRALKEIPTLRMLTEPLSVQQEKAERMMGMIDGQRINATFEKVSGHSEVGGGSLPLEKIPTELIGVRCQGISAAEAVKRLRALEIPVICRVQDDQLLLDPRTLFEEELELVVASLLKVLGSGGQA